MELDLAILTAACSALSSPLATALHSPTVRPERTTSRLRTRASSSIVANASFVASIWRQCRAHARLFLRPATHTRRKQRTTREMHTRCPRRIARGVDRCRPIHHQKERPLLANADRTLDLPSISAQPPWRPRPMPQRRPRQNVRALAHCRCRFVRQLPSPHCCAPASLACGVAEGVLERLRRREALGGVEHERLVEEVGEPDHLACLGLGQLRGHQ